jgi:hypothetical protein
MSVSDKDILAFLADMPPEMKQTAVKQMEALRGMTVAEVKARQADSDRKRIEEAEAFLSEIENNPGNYTADMIGVKLDEILGYTAVSKDLDRRIGLARWFIEQRNSEYGDNKPHANLTYEEFMKGKKPLKK